MARPEQINRSRGACIFHAADNIIIVRLLLGYLGRWCGYCCAWIINATGSNNAAALLANSTPDVALFACVRCNGLQRIRIWWTQILSGFKIICSLTSISSYRELLDHNVFRMKECRRRLVTTSSFSDLARWMAFCRSIFVQDVCFGGVSWTSWGYKAWLELINVGICGLMNKAISA